MGIADSSRELMAWIAELEDVDPFPLAEAEDLVAHALERGVITNSQIPAVHGRLVDLLDRGFLGATDPLGALDNPVAATDRAARLSELRTTSEGRHWLETAEDALQADGQSPSEPEAPKDARKVAVMHGRDASARAAIFDLLRRLGLDPMEWEELVDLTKNAAPYNGEAVAGAFAVAQAVVVVLTPDDVGYLHPELHGDREREDDREPTGQPRLNVILEAGMALQSHPTRTLLVELGHTREISDLAGRNAVRLDGSAEKFNSLASRLERAGCPVRRNRSDWLDRSAFENLAALTRTAPAVGLAEVGAGSDTRDRRMATERSTAARRQARHVLTELTTIDRTVESALENGNWWNVEFEALPAIQWEAARDVLADEAPTVYDVVAPVYVTADQMNKAAISQTLDGQKSYDESIRQSLELFRAELVIAKAGLRKYCGAIQAG